MDNNNTWTDLISYSYMKNQQQRCIRASKGKDKYAKLYCIHIKLKGSIDLKNAFIIHLSI